MGNRVALADIFTFERSGFEQTPTDEFVSREPRTAVSAETVPLEEARLRWQFDLIYVADPDALVETLRSAGVDHQIQTRSPSASAAYSRVVRQGGLMKTAPVKRFVEEVLATLPQPFGSRVIDDVFLAIEANPEWRRTYDELCAELTKHVVNTMGGRWIAQALGARALREAQARSALIESYSLLEGGSVTA